MGKGRSALDGLHRKIPLGPHGKLGGQGGGWGCGPELEDEAGARRWRKRDRQRELARGLWKRG